MTTEREAAPRTEAGRAFLHGIQETSDRLDVALNALDYITRIEAEARQQMKSETREQIFRDNGLIADPLAAASPAAPAVGPPDVSVLASVLDDAPGNIIESAKGDGEGLAAWIVSHWSEYVRLQDTVDQVASTGGEK